MGLIPLGGMVEMRLGKRRWRTHNLIVETGRTLVASLMTNLTTIIPSHGAVGDGNDIPEMNDIALKGVEHYRTLLASSANGPVVIYECVIVGSGSDKTVREAGIFNSSVGGTMLARWLTTEFVLPVGGQFYFKWTAEIAREVV